MSTTLLYHVYNIRGYRYRGMKYVPGGIEFTIEQRGIAVAVRRVTARM